MFAEDLSVFFDTDGLGTAATYGSSTVNGIFESDYYEPLNVVESSSPAFTCAESDVPAVAHGSTLIIEGTTYSVINVRPDGTGVVTLRLQKQ